MNAPMMSTGGVQDVQRMMLYDSNKKSLGLAYALWFFLGVFGAHRFYAGRTGSAVGMLIITLLSILLSVLLIGIVTFLVISIWWIIDAFLIPGWIRQYNNQLIANLQ